jgi:hypothetical protein
MIFAQDAQIHDDKTRKRGFKKSSITNPFSKSEELLFFRSLLHLLLPRYI